jgi:hypothetical protein
MKEEYEIVVPTRRCKFCRNSILILLAATLVPMLWYFIRNHNGDIPYNVADLKDKVGAVRDSISGSIEKVTDTWDDFYNRTFVRPGK